MVRLISMPRPFRIEENWGAQSVAMQSVTYARFHKHWFANITHASIGWEPILWFVLVQHYLGIAGLILLGAFTIVQVFSYRDSKISPILGAIWIVMAGMSIALYNFTHIEIVYLSKLFLISFGLWRYVGHMVEPIPPYLAGNEGFIDIKNVGFSPSLIPAFFLGPLAEFSAGLPYRLFNYWCIFQLLRFGVKPNSFMSIREISVEVKKVDNDGWSGSEVTAYLAK